MWWESGIWRRWCHSHAGAPLPAIEADRHHVRLGLTSHCAHAVPMMVPTPSIGFTEETPGCSPGSAPRARLTLCLTICHAVRMTVQIAVKLDDGLAEQIRAAAADAGTNLSDWVRAALQHQALVAKSMRARAEEDAREAVYTDEQEAALMAARRRRASATLDER
jgi:hypothetical protein